MTSIKLYAFSRPNTNEPWMSGFCQKLETFFRASPTLAHSYTLVDTTPSSAPKEKLSYLVPTKPGQKIYSTLPSYEHIGCPNGPTTGPKHLLPFEATRLVLKHFVLKSVLPNVRVRWGSCRPASPRFLNLDTPVSCALPRRNQIWNTSNSRLRHERRLRDTPCVAAELPDFNFPLTPMPINMPVDSKSKSSACGFILKTFPHPATTVSNAFATSLSIPYGRE
jgi:hypothetical protein